MVTFHKILVCDVFPCVLGAEIFFFVKEPLLRVTW